MCLCVSGVAVGAHAGSSNPVGTTNVLRANGEGEVITSGDYVSEPTGGIGTFYRFFVEVPPGLASLVVEVFDADVGAGGAAEGARDLLTSGAFDTSVSYRLFNPAGAQVGATVTCNISGAAPCLDNAFSSLFATQANPAAGHWELRIDMGAGDETVGFAVRAHDGDASAGGVELPVYAESFLGVGPTTVAPQVQTVYPYVTSGCQARVNDFDLDSNAASSLALVGSAGFAQSFTAVSGNGTWLSRNTNTFTSADSASNYGVWTWTLSINKAAGAAANMGVAYLGAFNSAVAGVGGAPTAQPEPNTFRLYLPTDGNTTPVKPSVEQFVRVLAGPNPPVAGQTTTVTVTVRATNPTVRPIVFSTSNVVTANIPGAGAVFAGAAAVGQGTIVSQPAVGATGAITWNPGVLAAGGISVLSYNVDVTPTAAGQTIAVTGTPANNGTTARFVDETGNTTQARATLSFGPLCELSVTSGTLTSVSIAQTRALRRPGGMRYQVQTVGEVNTLAFAIERYDAAAGAFVRVHDKVLAAFPPQPQGRLMSVDEDGVSFDTVRLRVIEFASDGVRVHGPFEVTATQAQLQAPAQTLRTAAALTDAALAVGRTLGAPRGEVRVQVEGMQSIELAQLATALSSTTALTRARLLDGAIALSKDGAPVPWLAWGEPLALWFYGVAGDDSYDTQGVYELTFAPGIVMATTVMPAVPPGAFGDVATNFDFERDVYAVTAVAQNPRDDFWFWQTLVANDATLGRASFTLPLVGAHHDGMLAVGLFGATTTPHDIEVRINGNARGSIAFAGILHVSRTVALTDADLAGGALDVELVAHGDADVDVVFVDGFSLTALAPAQLGVPFVSGGGATAVGPNDLVFDVTDPRAPTLLQRDGDVAVAAGRRVIITNGTVAGRPLVSRDNAVAPLHASTTVVVVAPAALAAAAQQLVSVHRDQGLTSAVVVLEDITDGYGHGKKGPEALRAFLRDAVSRGTTHVLLVGSGSLDERGLLGAGDALIPVPLRSTPQGLVAFDGAYADVDGDGRADLAVGRLPLTTPEQVQQYAARRRLARATHDVTIVSDNDEPAVAFGAAAQDVSEVLPFTSQHIAVDPTDINASRTALVSSLQQGANLLLYVGHGGLDRLADEGVLTSDDVSAINADAPAVVVGLTCVLNRFEDANFDGLGEALVHSGVASAVIAPSSAALHETSEVFGRALMAAMANSATVGDALLQAARVEPAATQIYSILGDPTVPAGAFVPAPPSCATHAPTTLWAALALLFTLQRRARRRHRPGHGVGRAHLLCCAAKVGALS